MWVRRLSTSWFKHIAPKFVIHKMPHAVVATRISDIWYHIDCHEQRKTITYVAPALFGYVRYTRRRVRSSWKSCKSTHSSVSRDTIVDSQSVDLVQKLTGKMGVLHYTEYVIFNYGTHITNHCVRARLGVRVLDFLYKAVSALLVEKRNIV